MNEKQSNRREFLKRALARTAGLGLSASVLSAWRAEGAAVETPALPGDDPNEFVFPRLQFNTLTRVEDIWNAHPVGDENLLAFLRENTNLKVSALSWEERVVSLEDPSRIFQFPFVFMTGEGDIRFSPTQATTLGEFFKRGGFLYVDDCVYKGKGDFFYKAFLREIKKALPGHEMRPVPRDHEIYHCFYDFPGRAPFLQGQPHPDMGLFLGKRLVCFLTAGDLHCAWTFPGTGRGRSAKAKARLRRDRRIHPESLKMGANIVIYALTH